MIQVASFVTSDRFPINPTFKIPRGILMTRSSSTLDEPVSDNAFSYSKNGRNDKFLRIKQKWKTNKIIISVIEHNHRKFCTDHCFFHSLIFSGLSYRNVLTRMVKVVFMNSCKFLFSQIVIKGILPNHPFNDIYLQKEAIHFIMKLKIVCLNCKLFASVYIYVCIV